MTFFKADHPWLIQVHTTVYKWGKCIVLSDFLKECGISLLLSKLIYNMKSDSQVPLDMIVHLIFEAFRLETGSSCPHDWVKVWNDNATNKGVERYPTLFSFTDH